MPLLTCMDEKTAGDGIRELWQLFADSRQQFLQTAPFAFTIDLRQLKNVCQSNRIVNRQCHSLLGC